MKKKNKNVDVYILIAGFLLFPFIWLRSKGIGDRFYTWLKHVYWYLADLSPCCGAILHIWDLRHIYCENCGKKCY